MGGVSFLAAKVVTSSDLSVADFVVKIVPFLAFVRLKIVPFVLKIVPFLLKIVPLLH